MSTDTQEAARTALSRRLRELLPAETTEHFIGGTHTRRFADNLLPSFSAEQVRALRAQLARGAGDELAATASGKRRAHAAYSSAALAANAFGGWMGAENQLRIVGLGGFDTSISLEHKLRIAHGGGEANLDCVLQSSTALVGIESKLTEPLACHQPVEWKAPYKRDAMATLLQDGWLKAFNASPAGAWRPQHLGLEQLLKQPSRSTRTPTAGPLISSMCIGSPPTDPTSPRSRPIALRSPTSYARLTTRNHAFTPSATTSCWMSG